MEVTIPLDKMSAAEKLRALEQIWDDLLRSGDIAPPAWHEDVLRAREGRLQTGEAHFSDWAEAKDRIRHRTQ